MTITAPGATPGPLHSTGLPSTGQASKITSDFDTFLRMLTVQMQNQDPLNPIESTDYAVQFLLHKGVAPEKIVIGAAFYARVWKDVAPTNNGLYQPGTHIDGYGYAEFPTAFSAAEGYEYHWDEVAQAPSYYSARHKTFATFDDPRSMAAKVDYLRKHQLGGIMFWQLPHDTDNKGLLDAIHSRLHLPQNNAH